MSARVTKYEQVMTSIRQKILSGEYFVGSQLPSEPQLQKQYGVSRVTIRLAVDGLVKDGLVERVQGKGSFVQRPQRVSRLVRESSVESFSKVALASGFHPQTKVLKVERVVATAALQSKFNVDVTGLLHTVRLRFFGSRSNLFGK
ncbi:GntR family transcriptional regulator [Lacticaseibacillus thailandensis]|uniref:GntR family transcriptional regulator n=1 Tax=Lacticaseibacillus thailandensis TaxID=381741 RepID=UPI0009E728FB|nr:GntR family transcriptional regulator [Lacticaseibacillus thailandensis]